MKAILALLLLFASLPALESDTTPSESPTPVQLDCGGCAPTLKFNVTQPPPIPCASARDAFKSIRFVELQDDHGGGFCGDCILPLQKCTAAADAKCTIHAKIRLTLKQGYSFSDQGSVSAVELPVNVTTECNSGFSAPELRVYAGTCSFAVRIDYVCTRCACPQAT